MQLTSADIDAVCGLVHDLCGIYLDDSKAYLIKSRLADLVQSNGCSTYVDLVTKARQVGGKQLTNEIVDAISTNETLFFRDGSPFEAFQHKVLPELIDSKVGSVFSNRLRIWSAACSSGQEPYSIAMTLSELLPNINDWDVQILASDVSDQAVKKASRGWFSSHEIDRGLNRNHLSRYFHQEDGGWRVKDEIRALISFEKRNLLDSLGMPRRFDIVFCRNVAIYFTPEVRESLFKRIAETLTPEGYLFVGSQESLVDLGPRFSPHHHCRATFYRPNLQAAPA